MSITVTYYDAHGLTNKTGYMVGDTPDDCLNKAISSVKPYAVQSETKIEATGTRDYVGYWTNELQPTNFWDDPMAKRFVGPERPKY